MSTEPRRRPMANIVLLLLCFFPGVSHILLGRYKQGAAMVVLALFALNGLLVLGPNLEPREQGTLLYTVSVIVLIALWGYSIFSLIALSFRPVHPELKRQSKARFQDGMVDYLKSDLDAAQTRFEEAASIDTDNPDAQFHLAMIYKHKGMVKEARRAFQRSLALDPEKWAWEIDRELKEL